MKKKLKHIIFDLDGTIIDSRKDICNSINYMLEFFNIHRIPPEIIISFVGDGLGKLLDRTFKFRETRPPNGAFEIFSKHYEENCLKNTVIYAGFLDFAAAMNGLPLSLVTNKALRFTNKILKGLKIRDLFDLVLGGDSLQKSKPDPEPFLFSCNKFKVNPEDALIIGDSSKDIIPGKMLKMVTAAVSFGYVDKNDLLELEPDFLADSYMELEGMLRKNLNLKSGK